MVINDSPLLAELNEKKIPFKISSFELIRTILKAPPAPDVILLWPDIGFEQTMEFLTVANELSYKGMTVRALDGNFTSQEIITYSGKFNHFIFDVHDRLGITKKVSNLLSLTKIKQEKERLKKLETTLEEESSKLVEVNVSNVKLIAEVNHKNKLVEIAKKDLQNLLDNLDQGFLTIDRTGAILPGYSSAVKKIFEIDPDGKNVTDLLRLDQLEATTCCDWLGMIFDELLPFNDLNDLGQNIFTLNNKFVEIDYRPIRGKDSHIEKLIVIATDKTREHELAQKAHKEEQFARMISTIIRDRGAFLDFIIEAKSIILHLEEEFNADNEPNIAECFRLAHTLKGNSAAFHFEEVKQFSHDLEDSLGELREDNPTRALERFRLDFKTYLSKFNILSLTFTTTLNAVENVLGRFGHEQSELREIKLSEVAKFQNALITRYPDDKDLYTLYCEAFIYEPFRKYLMRFEMVIKGIADRMGKNVSLTINDNDIRIYIWPYKELLQNFIHIFRNALDHGIESPEERTAVGKNPVGAITISTLIINKESQKMLIFTLRDDGRGIDPDLVKAKAIEKGIVDEFTAKSASQEQIFSYLLLAGFSTRDSVTEWSGRGVGLDAVAKECEKLGGSISVNSQKGYYTEFTITVPIFQVS
jgi:two-component system chemotaxis sensor kinase CheA